jgi:hypothetical protein
MLPADMHLVRWLWWTRAPPPCCSWRAARGHRPSRSAALSRPSPRCSWPAGWLSRLRPASGRVSSKLMLMHIACDIPPPKRIHTAFDAANSRQMNNITLHGVRQSHRCWRGAAPQSADAVVPHHLPDDHHRAALPVLFRLQPHLQGHSKLGEISDLEQHPAAAWNRCTKSMASDYSDWA